jgi:hypothetical protein
MFQCSHTIIRERITRIMFIVDRQNTTNLICGKVLKSLKD